MMLVVVVVVLVPGVGKVGFWSMSLRGFPKIVK